MRVAILRGRGLNGALKCHLIALLAADISILSFFQIIDKFLQLSISSNNIGSIVWKHFKW